MATATLNGVEFSFDSISEMAEFAKQLADARIPERKLAVENKPRNKPNKPVSNSSGSYTVTAHCGHEVTRNSPRGRKPAQCSECAGTVDRTDKPAERPQKGGGGGKKQFQIKPLEEMPDDKPASANQVERIHVQLGDAKLTNSKKKAITAEIEKGLSVRRASELYRWLKDQPRR